MCLEGGEGSWQTASLQLRLELRKSDGFLVKARDEPKLEDHITQIRRRLFLIIFREGYV